MSDWLLQGVDPRDPAGKDLFFDPDDLWFDIVDIVYATLSHRFPILPNNPLGWLEDRECQTLAALVDELVNSGDARTFMKMSGEYRDAEEGTILEDLQRFSTFLKHCGGYMADVAYR
jgi:hypothetical protein